MSATSPDLRLGPDDARTMVESGQAMILDVVSSSVYPVMHEAIAGAVRIAPEELAARAGELPRATTIITYCT